MLAYTERCAVTVVLKLHDLKPSWMGQDEPRSQESSGEVCQLAILPNLDPSSSRAKSTKGIKGDTQYKSNMH